MTDMTRQDKEDALTEALSHLEQAEALIRKTGDQSLIAYTADQIDSSHQMLGNGIYQLVEQYRDNLQNETEDLS